MNGSTWYFSVLPRVIAGLDSLCWFWADRSCSRPDRSWFLAGRSSFRPDSLVSVWPILVSAWLILVYVSPILMPQSNVFSCLEIFQQSLCLRSLSFLVFRTCSDSSRKNRLSPINTFCSCSCFNCLSNTFLSSSDRSQSSRFSFYPTRSCICQQSSLADQWLIPMSSLSLWRSSADMAFVSSVWQSDWGSIPCPLNKSAQSHTPRKSLQLVKTKTPHRCLKAALKMCPANIDSIPWLAWFKQTPWPKFSLSLSYSMSFCTASCIKQLLPHAVKSQDAIQKVPLTQTWVLAS